MTGVQTCALPIYPLHKLFPSDFCRFVNSTEIANLAGLKSNDIIDAIDTINKNHDGGIFFPHGIWFSPQSLIKKLVDHPNITIHLNQNITHLLQLPDNSWQIVGNNRHTTNSDNLIDTAPNIVLCNSYNINQFDQLSGLNLRKIRGQISIAPTNNLKVIVCGTGYITPARNNECVIGATFNFTSLNTEVTNEDHIDNITKLQHILPDTAKNIDITTLKGKASIRVSTTDYLPLVGPIANESAFKETYKKLSLDSNYWIETPCPYLKGLFLNVAHGAKGMLTAPICGEIIASYINNTKAPCSEYLRQAIHPNRVWRNEIIKSHQ